MDRKTALQVIKVAGYHDDNQAFMRTYCENRISYKVATEWWMLGKNLKVNGAKCDCHQCKKDGVAA